MARPVVVIAVDGLPTEPPVNVTLPSISAADLIVGTEAEGNVGAYDPAATSYQRQWYRDSGGDAISGATGSDYVFTDDDIDHDIIFGVVPINAAGTGAEAFSDPVGPILESVPVNSALPTISGVPEIGQTLSGGDGVWEPTPSSYARQWYMDSAGDPISGETGSALVLGTATDGHEILFGVKGINATGTGAEAFSAPAGPVTPPSFVPLLDGLSSSPLGAWAYCQLLTSYTGALFKLRRDSDNATSDFSAVSNGEPDAAAITAWAAGANLFVVTLYDQSGDNNDLTQATAGNQLPFTVTAMGGKVGEDITATDRWLQPASSTDFNNLMTGGMAFHVAYQTQSALQSFQSPIWSKDNLFNRGFGFGLDDANKAMILIQCATSNASFKASAATTSKIYCETVNLDGTAADNAATWRRNGASLSYTGVAGSGSIINDNLTLRWGSGAFQAGQKVRKGQFVLFAAPLSGADLQTVNDRATAFYGAT